MTKFIVLCADDYGQVFATSKAILTLLEQERLSATTCIVNMPHWREHAKWLKPYIGKIDIGLHINLTEGFALSGVFIEKYGHSLFKLPSLIVRSLMNKLNLAIIEAEIMAQLDQFEAEIGVLPDFLDGHQYIHQFPIVREALLNVYHKKKMQRNSTYVRVASERLQIKDYWVCHKKILIRLLGVQKLTNLLSSNHIRYNTSFSGIYTFHQAKHYPTYFRQFINSVTNKGIIVCHPAFLDQSSDDIMSHARKIEFDFLSSDNFISNCKQKDILLTRF